MIVLLVTLVLVVALVQYLVPLDIISLTMVTRVAFLVLQDTTT